jgi:hypothetical integral membrane protein (TIGR02206 family)
VQRFGAGHLTVLAATAVAIALAAALGRKLRERPATLARCLAYVILAAMALDPFVHEAHGELTLAKALPLQLCDAAAAVCALALLVRRQLPFELSYFWGLAGVTQALATPPALAPLDDPDTWRYVTVHAATLAGVAYLMGLGFRPRRGAWRRATLLTMAYAAAVGLADWALKANYMWLASKPEGSVLGLFGPWPWYIALGAVLGAALFYVLEVATRPRAP